MDQLVWTLTHSSSHTLIFFFFWWYYFILFLKNLNILDLKTKNCTLRISRTLFFFFFGAAKAFSLSICHQRSMDIWRNEELGCWAKCTWKTRISELWQMLCHSLFLLRCGLKTMECTKSACLFCSMGVLLNMIWHYDDEVIWDSHNENIVFCMLTWSKIHMLPEEFWCLNIRGKHELKYDIASILIRFFLAGYENKIYIQILIFRMV